MDVRTPRIARTASLIVSTAFSLVCEIPLILVLRPGRNHDGRFLILQIAEDFLGDERHIWMQQFRVDWIRTVFRVQSAAALVVSSSDQSLGFTISMYQSQNSSQMKS